MKRPLFTPVGEHALRFELPALIDRSLLLAHLRAQPGVTDASLAAEHALVVFEDEPRELAIPDSFPPSLEPRRAHDVRVVYDGPDLEDVAHALGIDTDALVRLHTGRTHAVLFVGFCPGFAYLGPIDPALAVIARRPSPRARVPAGSVGLAGGYTGIYPSAMPGGWRLLGRAIDFDPFVGDRLAVGDLVRFVPACRA